MIDKLTMKKTKTIFGIGSSLLFVLLGIYLFVEKANQVDVSTSEIIHSHRNQSSFTNKSYWYFLHAILWSCINSELTKTCKKVVSDKFRIQ